MCICAFMSMFMHLLSCKYVFFVVNFHRQHMNVGVCVICAFVFDVCICVCSFFIYDLRGEYTLGMSAYFIRMGILGT